MSRPPYHRSFHRRSRPLAAVILLFLTACVAPYTPDPDNTITLLTPTSIVLSAQGEQAVLRAEIRRPDGTVDERAALALTSSDPDSVTIAADGTVTAQVDLGSATITLASEALTPVVVTVLIAQTLDWTHLLDDDDVVSASADQSEIVLHRNPATRDLEVGDVIVSGENGGVFARILAIERQGDTMAIEGRLALLSEVFAELDLDLTGASEPIAVDVENGVATVRTGSGQVVHQGVLDDLACEAGSGIAAVSFTGFAFDANLERMSPTVRYSETADLSNPDVCALFPLECVVVEEFALAIDAEASIEAGFGTLRIAGALEANVECKLELPPLPILPAPLFGPLLLAGSVTPSLTVTVGGTYNGASFSLRGPALDKGIALAAGFDYRADAGFRTIGNGGPTFSGPGLTWGAAEGEIESELSLAIEPAFHLTAGIAVFVSGEAILPFNLAKMALKGGAEVTLGLPIDPKALTYRGPRWRLYIGASADLNPLLESLGAVEKLLELVGLGEQGSDLFALDLTLFAVETTVLSGPEPDVSAQRQGTSRTVALSTSDDALDDGTAVRFLAAEALEGGGHGPLEEVASATVQGGTATSTWEAPGDGAQHYQITARIDSIFGDALPYGPEGPADVDLGGSITLEPASLTLTLGVGQASDEAVALVSEGLAADYEVVGSQPHVTVANPQGSIAVDGTVELRLSVTCPEVAGAYPQTFDLVFTNGDGEAIEGGVPELLSIDLTCTDDPLGFALLAQIRSAIASIDRQGPPNTRKGEDYISDDASGTGTYTVTDIVDGVDNSTTTEVGPLGFGSVDVSAAAAVTCAVEPDRSSSASASSTSTLAVAGSIITFTGDLDTELATSSRFQCPTEVQAFSDGAGTTIRLEFELSTSASLTGSWTCDGGFDRGTILGTGSPQLFNLTEQLWIFDGRTDPCEVDLDIPAGHYRFNAALGDGIQWTDAPLEGISRTKNGSFTFTITMPD